VLSILTHPSAYWTRPQLDARPHVSVYAVLCPTRTRARCHP
jgi:hypothetical protein